MLVTVNTSTMGDCTVAALLNDVQITIFGRSPIPDEASQNHASFVADTGRTPRKY
jgi:hypothetical protein